MRGPSQERGIGLRLTRKTQSASSEFMLGRRESLESYTPMQFTQTYNVDSRWSLQASLGRHLATQETLAMRMGGMKDRVSLGSSYQLSRLDQITLELASERYRVQSGARVGSGNHAMLQYLHTYRSEAPTLQFGAFTSWHRYSRTDPALLQGRDAAILGYLPAFNDPTIDYLLPRSFRFSGLQMMFNTGYEQQYTRAAALCQPGPDAPQHQRRGLRAGHGPGHQPVRRGPPRAGPEPVQVGHQHRGQYPRAVAHLPPPLLIRRLQGAFP